MKKAFFVILFLSFLVVGSKDFVLNNFVESDFQVSKIVHNGRLVQGDQYGSFVDDNNSGYMGGDVLMLGDVMRTSSGAKAIIDYFNGEGHGEVTIMEDTDVRVNGNRRLGLSSGELLMDLEGEFEVETEFVTAGVEGTRFFVTSDEEKSHVGVDQGKVKIKSNFDLWEPVFLEGGMQLIVYMDGSTKVSELPQERSDQIGDLVFKLGIIFPSDDYLSGNGKPGVVAVSDRKDKLGASNGKHAGKHESIIKPILKQICRAQDRYHGDYGEYTTDELGLYAYIPRMLEENRVEIVLEHANKSGFLVIGWHKGSPDDKWSINKECKIIKK